MSFVWLLVNPQTANCYVHFCFVRTFSFLFSFFETEKTTPFRYNYNDDDGAVDDDDDDGNLQGTAGLRTGRSDYDDDDNDNDDDDDDEDDHYDDDDDDNGNLRGTAGLRTGRSDGCS